MTPLISIVIPVYNVADFITKCLDSIRNQTYKNLQVVLVIDGSKDNSEEICRQYADIDSRFEVIVTENQGSAEARNVGLKYVKGEFITFIDSDDYVSFDYIERLYTLLIKTNADISVVDYIYFSKTIPENRRISDTVISYETKEQFDLMFCKLYEGQKSFPFITPWAKLIPAKYFDDVKFPKGKCFDDEATMYLVYLKANKIVYNDTQCYFYYRNEEGISNTIYKKNLQDFLPVLEDRMVKFSNLGYSKAFSKTTSKLFSKLVTYYLHYDICNKTETIIKLKQTSKILLTQKYSSLKDKIKSIFFLICPKIFLFYRKVLERNENVPKIN